MKDLHKLVILLGFIFCTRANNDTFERFPQDKIKFEMCNSDSKHCIECLQVVSRIPMQFQRPFDQVEYRIDIMDKLNRARSQYAITNGISNMKYANWVKEFEAMTQALSFSDMPITHCNLKLDGKLNTNYRIYDFKSIVQMERKQQQIQLIRQQFDNFTEQFIASPDMMTYNLNEFGCCYVYDTQRFQVTMLMRCMVYLENRLNTSVLKTGKLCDDCEYGSERCIELDWYRGLCVFRDFNETRLRLKIEPEIDETQILSSQLMFRSSLYVLNVIVVFLIVYVLYAMCVICRHNSLYEKHEMSDNESMEFPMPVMENIYKVM